ncbi:MAG TPA: hypothetical protein VGC61_05205, partial [Pyrinomonadaceae bacterium]
FIPSLVRRDLEDSKTDYNVAIVSLEDPARVIYSSGSGVDASSSDVSTRIFGLEADELRTFLSNDDQLPKAPAAAQPATRATRPLRLINFRFLKRLPENSAASSNEEEGRWQLLIKHRAARWPQLSTAPGAATSQSASAFCCCLGPEFY